MNKILAYFHPKVKGGTAAAGLATGAIWALENFGGVKLDPSLTNAIVTVAGFVGGWLIPSQ